MSKWHTKLAELEIFDSPEQAHSFGEWESTEQERINRLCRYMEGKGDAITILLLYLYDEACQKCQKFKKDAEEWEDNATRYRGAMQRACMARSNAERERANAITARNKLKQELDNIRMGQATKKNLEEGRPKGVKTRKLNAQEHNEELKKATEEFFTTGVGWRMRNKQIASKLFDTGKTHYTYNTLLKKVNPIIAAIKKADKEKTGL